MTMRLCYNCRKLFADGGYIIEDVPHSWGEYYLKKCDNCGNRNGEEVTIRKKKMDLPDEDE